MTVDELPAAFIVFVPHTRGYWTRPNWDTVPGLLNHVSARSQAHVFTGPERARVLRADGSIIPDLELIEVARETTEPGDSTAAPSLADVLTRAAGYAVRQQLRHERERGRQLLNTHIDPDGTYARRAEEAQRAAGECEADAVALRSLSAAVRAYVDADGVVNADTDAISLDDYAAAVNTLAETQRRLLARILGEVAS